MIKPVVGTIATRIVIAVANLLVVVTATRHLGLEAVGTIALLVLAVSFILLVTNIVGGSGLVYLAPRHGAASLRWPSYLWCSTVCVASWPLLQLSDAVPYQLVAHTVVLAFLQGLSSTHFGLLLGQERYRVHNALQVLQAALVLVALLVLLRIEGPMLMDYVHALLIAHAATAILSGSLSMERGVQRTAHGHPIADLLRQGIPAQAANGLQLLNYRLAYYFVERWSGAAALGMFSITTQLAESTWLAPKSLGSVLYARVSTLRDGEQQRLLTLTVLKLSVALALAAIALLLAVPDSVYAWLFSPEVSGISRIVLWLAPGLIAMSASQALSHYLSGTGRVHHNTIGSGIGVVATVGLGAFLIPRYGVTGAAMTASIAYSSSVIYQGIVFNRLSHTPLHDYLPTTADHERIRTLINRLLGR